MSKTDIDLTFLGSVDLNFMFILTIKRLLKKVLITTGPSNPEIVLLLFIHAEISMRICRP